jgi:hypothetical protein
MKRSQSVHELNVLGCAFAGNEAACVCTALVACADSLQLPLMTGEGPVGRGRCDLWLHLGAALARHVGSDVAFSCLQVADLLSRAWPVRCFATTSMVGVGFTACVVVTPQSAFAVLLGGTHVFDSRAVTEEDTAALIDCGSAAGARDYILSETEGAETWQVFAVTERPFLLPAVFPVQDAAFRAADVLPPGFLYVFARDKVGSGNEGAKTYLVAGLRDFEHYYAALLPEARMHYDIARLRRPVCFYADLEFDVYEENAGRDTVEMLNAFLEAVRAEWAQPLTEPFCSYDSSSARNAVTHDDDQDEEEEEEEEQEQEQEDELSVSMSLESDLSGVLDDDDDIDSDYNDEEEEGEEEDVGELERVSFHTHNRGMVFDDNTALERFMVRVQERCHADARLRSLLWVWKPIYNPKSARDPSHQPKHVMQKVFFADLSVYSANRCFRLPYSSKAGKARYFWPMSEGDAFSWQAVEMALICPPEILWRSLGQEGRGGGRSGGGSRSFGYCFDIVERRNAHASGVFPRAHSCAGRRSGRSLQAAADAWSVHDAGWGGDVFHGETRLRNLQGYAQQPSVRGCRLEAPRLLAKVSRRSFSQWCGSCISSAAVHGAFWRTLTNRPAPFLPRRRQRAWFCPLCTACTKVRERLPAFRSRGRRLSDTMRWSVPTRFR